MAPSKDPLVTWRGQGYEIEASRPGSQIQAIKDFYISCGYTGPVTADDLVVVARSESQIVGVVRLVREDGVDLLRGMYLSLSWQRRGIGSAMLKVFKDLATLQKLPRIYLTCGPHLQAFYGSIGFECVNQQNEIPGFLAERSAKYARDVGPQVIMRRVASS